LCERCSAFLWVVAPFLCAKAAPTFAGHPPPHPFPLPASLIARSSSTRFRVWFLRMTASFQRHFRISPDLKTFMWLPSEKSEFCMCLPSHCSASRPHASLPLPHILHACSSHHRQCGVGVSHGEGGDGLMGSGGVAAIATRVQHPICFTLDTAPRLLPWCGQ
jgi:hypothetical protein